MTRNKIKKAALSAFVKDGYEGARVADIAKAVDIKAASLYFHFESKEMLFTEVFEDMRDQRLANVDVLLQKVGEMDRTEEKLFCIYDDYCKQIEQNREERIFWKRSALFPPSFLKNKIDQDLIAYQEKFRDALVKPVIRQGIQSGQLKKQNEDKIFVALLSIIGAVFTEIHYSNHETYQEKINMLWEFFWDSIKSN